MIRERNVFLFAVAFLSVAGVAAADTPATQPAQGSYRGMYVCQKIGGSRDILHVPIDLTVRSDTVEFARPLFNLEGTRVIGNEMASGKIDSDGKVRITSNWDNLGFAFKAEYAGTLTPTGGTFMGTQTWHGPGDMTGSRTCTAAVVQIAEAEKPSSQQ